MEKILSIIVPTYNMERLLEKCLSSFIIKQMNLLEIIVVMMEVKINLHQLHIILKDYILMCLRLLIKKTATMVLV